MALGEHTFKCEKCGVDFTPKEPLRSSYCEICESKHVMRFDGKYFFLSNFYPAEVEFEGITYCTSENAFQASKSLDKKVRESFANYTPGKAKREGRAINPLRGDWEKVKVDIMRSILKIKFSDPILRKKLLDTDGLFLMEGNTWGDLYWGTDLPGRGMNKLGNLLMEIREEIKKEK